MPQSLVGTMILDAAKTAGLMGGVGAGATETQGAPPTREASGSAVDLKGSLAPLMDDATGLLDTVGSHVISTITDSAFLLHDALLEIHQAIADTSIISKLMNLALDEIKISVRTIADDVGLVMTELLGLREALLPTTPTAIAQEEPVTGVAAEESTAPKWMTAIMGAIKDIKDAPGAMTGAAGRAVGMAKDKALGIPGVEKAAGIIKEGMNISGDIKDLASPVISKMKKPVEASMAGAGKAAGMFAGGGKGGKLAGEAMKGMATGIPKMAGFLKGMAGKGMGMAGISVSVSSLLRQSQIFTGFVGALFQILGGFVDVILAPFMPFFFKILTKLASWIPHIAAMAQKVFNWLAENIFPIIAEWAGKIGGWILKAWNWVKDTLWPIAESILNTVWEKIQGLWDWVQNTLWPVAEPIIAAIGEKITEAWTWLESNAMPIIEGAFETIGTIVGEVWTAIQTNLQPIWETIQDVLDRAWTVIKEDIWPLIQTIWDVSQPIITRIKDLLLDTIFPLITTIFNEIFRIYTDVVLGIIERVAPFIEEMLPIIKDRIIEVINKFEELVAPLKDAITGIADDLAPKIEALLDWMEENIFPLIEKITGIFFDNVIKIMDLVQDLWDIAYPSIQSIIEDFDKHVMPIIQEMAGYAVEIIDAILDIVNPLVDLLIPVIKFAFTIFMFFLKIGFKVIFKVLSVIWIIAKPFVKLTIWILRQIPAIINGLADFIGGFLEFQWLKDFAANILKGFHWIVQGLSEMKFIGGAFKGAAEQLQGMINVLQPTTALGGNQPITIAITNNLDGLKEPTQQQTFDASDMQLRQVINSMNVGSDISSISNWQATPSYS